MLLRVQPGVIDACELGESSLGAMASGMLRPNPSGVIGNWSPGIGDPTVTGWIAVIAYLATAVVCFRLARRIPKVSGSLGRERVLWTVIAGVFLALGINKQLDLQSAITEIGRILADRQGWYERRRAVQRQFVAGVALLAVVAMAGAIALARGSSRAARLAILGTGLVLAFVVVRAASAHRFDHFIGSEWFGIKNNAILELGGIAVVFAAAQLRLRVTGRRARVSRARSRVEPARSKGRNV